MRSAYRTTLVLAALLGVLVAPVASAHRPSDSLLSLELKGTGLEGHWDLALRDLDYVMGLDRDHDGKVTWGELRNRSAEIERYALSRLRVEADGAPCQVAVAGAHLVVRHSGGSYTVLPLTVACPSAPRNLQVVYDLLFDVDPQHRGLARLTAAGASQSWVFTSAARERALAVADAQPGRQLRGMVREGVMHIAEGWDHLLFLLAMLLPAVLVRSGKRWEPLGQLRPALENAVKVVTAFTLAHSITLTLSALDYVNLPSRWVESAIAASIVIAAADNLVPLFKLQRWTVAFGLGLIHGFGFASVLRDLGLPSGSLALSLLGFNLGVELGQLAIVGAFFPLAFWLRRTVLYRKALFVGGSLFAAALGGVWLLDRAFGFALLPG